MEETLMTVTAYCKYADLSRKAFYDHRKHGILAGCFARKSGSVKDFVIQEKADIALKRNVSFVHKKGGMALKRKMKMQKQAAEEPPELFDPVDAVFLMHRYLCSEFGLTFQELNKPVTLADMEARTADGLDYVFSYLSDIAEGTAKNPVESAVMAVFSALIGTTPACIDFKKFAKRPRLLMEIDKLKKPEKENV